MAGEWVLKRSRGRPIQAYPSNKVLEILNLLKMGLSGAEVAREYDCSRQYVHEIKKRWSNYL